MKAELSAENDRGMALGRAIGRRTPRPLIRPLLAVVQRLAPKQYERALRTVQQESREGGAAPPCVPPRATDGEPALSDHPDHSDGDGAPA